MSGCLGNATQAKPAPRCFRTGLSGENLPSRGRSESPRVCRSAYPRTGHRYPRRKAQATACRGVHEPRSHVWRSLCRPIVFSTILRTYLSSNIPTSPIVESDAMWSGPPGETREEEASKVPQRKISMCPSGKSSRSELAMQAIPNATT